MMLTLATKFRPDELQAYDTAQEASLRAVEFWLDASLLLDWKNIVATARKYNFRYALHFPNYGVLDADALQGAVCLYRELKCRTIIIHQPMHDAYGESLLSLDSSLHLAVENHDLDAAGFSLWAEQNRWLTLDVEHLWLCTLKNAPLETMLTFLEQFLTQYGKKLRHIHLPGYQVGGEEHMAMHYSPQMAAGVLSLLADAGYSELVVSEADQKYQNLDDLRKDVAVFEGWRMQYSALVNQD
jgi:hypothetical protein